MWIWINSLLLMGVPVSTKWHTRYFKVNIRGSCTVYKGPSTFRSDYSWWALPSASFLFHFALHCVQCNKEEIYKRTSQSLILHLSWSFECKISNTCVLEGKKKKKKVLPGDTHLLSVSCGNCSVQQSFARLWDKIQDKWNHASQALHLLTGVVHFRVCG